MLLAVPSSAGQDTGGDPLYLNLRRKSVMDVAWPEGQIPRQEDFLSAYPPSQEKNRDLLGPDDFAQIPMLREPASSRNEPANTRLTGKACSITF